MHFYKLVKVLQSFDRARLTRLKKYVRSPYFGIYPPSVTLFNYLAPLHPRFLPQKITCEAIAVKNKNLLSRHMQVKAGTCLMRVIEKFIALEEWQKNEAEVTRYRLKGFKELQLMAEFDKGSKKEIDQLKKNPEQNFDIFFERHALTELSFNGFDAKLNRTGQNDIMPVVKTLDEFYALKKLRYLCEAFNRQQVLGSNYTDEHVPALLKILEPYNNSRYPYAYLFINVYRMMAADNFEDSNLHYLLIKQFASLNSPTPAIREAMTYAVNRCLYWNNKGYEEAGSEYLWWIAWKMKHNLLLEKGKLMPITFRNMVMAAFSLKKPEQIEQVITAYAPHLPAEHHDTNLSFANGLYHYSLKNYKKAIRFFLMAQAKETAVFNSLIRRWHWMCLYEYDRNDTDALYNSLLAFEKYLQRNKEELHNRYEVFNRFLHYACILLKAPQGDMLSSHISDLQNEEHFGGKPWLTEQFTAKNKKTRLIARVQIP